VISRQQVKQSLTKLGMLKYFPADTDVIVEIGRRLTELCADDEEAQQLTALMVAMHDEWPGPLSMSTALAEVRRRKHEAEEKEKAKQDRAAAQLLRDAHEASCPGYSLTLDEEDKTVHVRFCRCRFGRDTQQLVFCRKGDSLQESDPTFCERLTESELAARPGWATWDQRFMERFWKRKGQCK
jgi:hypothetical protein